MKWADRIGEVIFISLSYGIFYLTAKGLLSHCKKVVLIKWLLSGNFYIFSIDSRTLQHFILLNSTLWICSLLFLFFCYFIGLYLYRQWIWKENSTQFWMKYCVIDAEIWGKQEWQNERTSIKKKTCWYKAGRIDLWWGYFVSGVTPKEFWKKSFRLKGASFFDPVITAQTLYFTKP